MLPVEPTVALRITQTFCAVIVFFTAVLGNLTTCRFSGIPVIVYNNDSINFLIALGVMVSIFVPAWAYVFEVKKLKPLPHPAASVAFDGLWAFLTLIGGIAAAASDLIADTCSQEFAIASIQQFCSLDCDALKTSVAFTFFIFFASLASAALGYQRFASGASNVYTSA